LLDCQIASVVTLRELPSDIVAVAESCTLCPTVRGESHPLTMTLVAAGAGGAGGDGAVGLSLPQLEATSTATRSGPLLTLQRTPAEEMGIASDIDLVRPVHNVPGHTQHFTPP
jgi:hypothetical protein